MSGLGERIECHQSVPGLDSGFKLARGILLRGQPVQDIANDGERAVALRREPFLKGFRIEVEFGQKLATIGISRSLQVAPVRRTGQPLEPIKINGDVLQPTIGQEPIERWCFPVEMPFDQPGRGDPFASILRALIGGGKQNPPVKPFRSWPRLIAYA